MAAIAGVTREPIKIDTSLANKTAPIDQQSAPVTPFGAPATQPQQNQAAPNSSTQNQSAPVVPLAQ